MQQSQLILDFDGKPATRIVKLFTSERIRPISNKEGIGDYVINSFSGRGVVRAKVLLDETVTNINHGSGNFNHTFSATIDRNNAKWGQRLGKYEDIASYRDPDIMELWKEVKNYIEERSRILVVGDLEHIPTNTTDVYKGEFTISRRNPFNNRLST